METRSPQDLADLRRPFPPVPRHADRRLAGSHELCEVFGIAREAERRPRPRPSTTRSRRRWPRRSSARGACSSGSTSRCCAPPTPPPIRWTTTRRSAQSGWEGDVRPTFRPDAVVNLDADGWRANIDRLSAVSGDRRAPTTPRSSRRWKHRRAFFKQMGAHGHRSRRADALHRRAAPARGGRHLPARAARRGHRRGRAPLHRPHADGDGAHEHRGWAGDAAPRRVVPQPQPRRLRSALAATRAPTSRSQPSSRATCARCSTSTATIRA